MLSLNCLPNDKISDSTKMEALAYDKLNLTHIGISFFDKGESIVKNGENVGYQHFLLLPRCFQEPAKES